ncbi:MAG: AAA family ATPase [Stackebrandtia sp.]
MTVVNVNAEEYGHKAETLPRLSVVKDAPAAPKPRTHWTAQELMAAHFPAPKWAVPGIISEGVNLLCGPPKVGKSWASLDLGLAVAGGGKAFGSIDVDQGDVLYLALEDTGRRLQSRMRKLLGTDPAPAGFDLVTACPTMDRGGAEAIADWLTKHRSARLVVIDVFTKIRGQAMPGSSAYEADYAAVNAIKHLADTFAVPFVVVHHVRKMGSEDFLSEVSGTHGVAGAADATMVLKRTRHQADGVLAVTGRDIDETEYAVSWDKDTGRWNLLDGNVDELTTTDTRAAIIAHLRTHEAAGPRAIAKATDINEATVKSTCRRMKDDGILIADARGHYAMSGE